MINRKRDMAPGSGKPYAAEEKLKERVKDLNCLYSLSKLVEKPDLSLEEIFLLQVNELNLFY